MFIFNIPVSQTDTKYFFDILRISESHDTQWTEDRRQKKKERRNTLNENEEKDENKNKKPRLKRKKQYYMLGSKNRTHSHSFLYWNSTLVPHIYSKILLFLTIVFSSVDVYVLFFAFSYIFFFSLWKDKFNRDGNGIKNNMMATTTMMMMTTTMGLRMMTILQQLNSIDSIEATSQMYWNKSLRE